tara:strand:- start:190 stop:444 length:255 start_codon:yes stop_codon:yes gene_type:complete
MIRVENIQHLKQLAHKSNGYFVNFQIVLAGGLVTSSKRIQFNSDLDQFSIINEIDESFQEVKSDQLGVQTNLIETMRKNALFQD